nr:EOG090X09BQ [Eurycercus lamellatus]
MQHHQSRLKSDFELEWVPPPKISCIDPAKSGDRSPIAQPDFSSLRYTFLRSNPNQQQFLDRQDIIPEVKKLATLEFAPRKEQVKVIKYDALRNIQRHFLDTASMEAAITCDTITIRNWQKHLEVNRTDKQLKVALKEKIDRRNSWLKHLRRMDYKRFEWLLEKLDLVYYAPANNIERVTRKGAMRKLTAYYCNKIRQERIDAYKLELEKEKESFVKEKEELLKWIEQEEKELIKLKP